MIAWPVSLKRELAQRRCILFLGAGVSASARAANGTSPKTWSAFLTSACEKVSSANDRDKVQVLINERRYLLALQAIYSKVDPGDYHELIDHNFLAPQFKAGVLHGIIYQLDQRIVITTNFDKIYETYCLSTSTDGYKVISYDSQSLADELRSDTRLIIKAHGSIDSYRDLIFTREQYRRAKKDHSNFYDMLRSLFRVYTTVFIGCGMEDPDVMLMLEDIALVGSGRRPHYVLIKQGEHDLFVVKDWSESYNIQALEYGPTHENLIDDLEILFSDVDEMRKRLS